MTPTPFATPFATTAHTYITPQLTVVSLVRDVDEALATWEELGVDSYRLHLREDGVWWGIELIIEVHEGAPRSVMAECVVGWIGGPCDIGGFSMSDYVVEGLFARLSSAISTNPQPTQQVDSQSGIPTRIIYNHPEIYDEEWSITVYSITLLEANPLQSDTGASNVDMTTTAVAEEHSSP